MKKALIILPILFAVGVVAYKIYDRRKFKKECGRKNGIWVLYGGTNKWNEQITCKY